MINKYNIPVLHLAHEGDYKRKCKYDGLTWFLDGLTDWLLSNGS